MVRVTKIFLLALLLAAPVALADGPPEDESLVAGWQRGLRAVVTVVFVVTVAVVARRLGSRASSWSASRRRSKNPEEDPPERL